MRSRSLLLLSLALAAVPGLAASAWVALAAATDWRHATSALAMADAAGRVLHAADAMMLERGSLMSGTGPAVDAAETEAALTGSLQAMQAAGLPSELVDQARTALTSLRRQPGPGEASLQGMAALARIPVSQSVAAFHDMLAQTARTIAEANLAAGQLIAAAARVSTMREAVGRRSLLINHWARGHPLTAAQQADLLLLTGEIAATWSGILQSIPSNVAGAPVAAAVAATQAGFFGKAEPEYRGLIAAIGLGTVPAAGLPEFQQWNSAMLARLRPLREALVSQARDAAAAAAGAAWRSACLAASGVACVLGLTLGAGLLIQRTVALSVSREAALRQANRQLDAALTHMGQGLAMYDGAETLIVANRRYCELHGLAPGNLRPGLPLLDVIRLCKDAGNFAGLSVEDVYTQQRQHLSRQGTTSFVQDARPGRTLAVTIDPVADGGWVATFNDITDRCRAEDQLAFLARHDVLTGLPNRVVLRERLEHELAKVSRGHPLAVVLLDLDHFKSVNDQQGHPVGDRLLKLAGERIQACVREVDLVARLGGDEFAVVVADAGPPDQAGRVASRIIGAFRNPFEVDGCEIKVGVSLGIALAPGDGTSSDALLGHAELALHRAKADGRGTARFFEPGLNATHLVQRAADEDLRLAMERGEFELFYQPLINLDSDEVVAFEALLRWRHPVRGVVSPAEFIPVAERSGLIVALGEWVVRRACRDAAELPDGLGVAVNLSAVQFRSPVLVDAIRDALDESGLPPTRLELEITETVLLDDNAGTLAVLRDLQALGIRIAMDDFGTGYSSLNYLHCFPFDKIKIDRAFVQDLQGRGRSGAIVRAIAGLGASLGITTTAEGVETPEQLAFLHREGCTEAQGFLISRPVPAGEIPAFLAARQRECAGVPA